MFVVCEVDRVRFVACSTVQPHGHFMGTGMRCSLAMYWRGESVGSGAGKGQQTSIHDTRSQSERPHQQHRPDELLETACGASEGVHDQQLMAQSGYHCVLRPTCAKSIATRICDFYSRHVLRTSVGTATGLMSPFRRPFGANPVGLHIATEGGPAGLE